MFNNKFSQTPSWIKELEELRKFCENMGYLKTLISEKYLNVNVVKSRFTIDEEIEVTLLNDRHGVNQGIDEENERPIEYLKSFEAKVTQTEAKYPSWSYSVLTFDQSKLREVIEGLEKIPTPMPNTNNDISKMKTK